MLLPSLLMHVHEEWQRGTFELAIFRPSLPAGLYCYAQSSLVARFQQNMTLRLTHPVHAVA